MVTMMSFWVHRYILKILSVLWGFKTFICPGMCRPAAPDARIICWATPFVIQNAMSPLVIMIWVIADVPKTPKGKWSVTRTLKLRHGASTNDVRNCGPTAGVDMDATIIKLEMINVIMHVMLKRVGMMPEIVSLQMRIKPCR